MRLVTCCLAVLLCCFSATAQSIYARNEVGVTIPYSFNADYYERSLGGVGGRHIFALNQNLASDSEFAFYPKFVFPVANAGGRQFTVFSGLKGGISRNRYGVFVKMRPGLRHYTATAISGDRPNMTISKTHFALDVGGVVEFYPSPHWVYRFDAGEIFTRQGDHVDVRLSDNQGTSLTIVANGRIVPEFSASAGIAYRWGERHLDRSPAISVNGKTTVGLEYSFLSIARNDTYINDERGWGGWASYSLNRFLALDSALYYFPQNPKTISAQEGGTILQGAFGVKVGIAKRRFGVFVKARPGFMRFSETTTNYTGSAATVADLQLQPKTQLALDSGGVVELYSSKRFALRFDLGSTTVHYSSRRVSVPGATSTVPAKTEATIQLSTGVGFRF